MKDVLIVMLFSIFESTNVYEESCEITSELEGREVVKENFGTVKFYFLLCINLYNPLI